MFERTFKDSLEKTTDGAIFVVYIHKNWTKKNFQEVVEYIILHMKEKCLPPPVFLDPVKALNDLNDQKAKRQQAEYIFHSYLGLNLEIFASENFRITKIILKKEWFNEAADMLISKGFTINYLFPGYILVIQK